MKMIDKNASVSFVKMPTNDPFNGKQTAELRFIPFTRTPTINVDTNYIPVPFIDGVEPVKDGDVVKNITMGFDSAGAFIS
jgi:hypothetical protein